MGFIQDNFRMVYIGVAAAVYLRPEYVILNSKILTIIICFSILTLSKLAYQLALYPRYFTPIKHIPTPGVSSFSSLQSRAPQQISTLMGFRAEIGFGAIPKQSSSKHHMNC